MNKIKKKEISPQATANLRPLFQSDTVHQVTLGQAVEAFMRFEMIGKSRSTYLWYQNRLKLLLDYLGPGRLLSDIMEVDLIEWYEEIEQRTTRYAGGASRPEIAGGLSADSKHNYLRACKRLFKWLRRKGVLPVDLAADLKLPKLPRRGRKGIADVYVDEILEEAKSNVRDYALLRFIESTGIRRGGAANLLLSDLNLDSPDERIRRRATVREKGDKERTVIMTQGALEALESYLKVRPHIRDNHVFLGRQPGKPWKRLLEEGVSGVIRRYKERLALEGKCSPHQWRHRWCRKRLQEGMGLSQVSQLAGHEDIAVTAQFYGGFSIDELQDSYDKHVHDREK